MAEFSPAVTASVKMNVPMNGDGFIAQDGDTVKGTKSISIGGISAGANLAGANAVFTAFLGNIAMSDGGEGWLDDTTIRPYNG